MVIMAWGRRICWPVSCLSYKIKKVLLLAFSSFLWDVFSDLILFSTVGCYFPTFCFYRSIVPTDMSPVRSFVFLLSL